MSILDDILGTVSQAGSFYFEAQRQRAELEIAKKRADAEKAAQQANLQAAYAGRDSVYKFATWAFYVAMGFAGLAILTTFRRMWKGAK